MRQPKSGFTLIELLVVIAIIALLAAILFPVFARARENARKTSCLNNCKQMALGLMQYSQDYDELLPKGSSNNRGNGWAGPTLTYVKSSQAFVCPSDTLRPNNNPQISYAYNGAVTFPINGYSGSGALAEFNSTARTILVFEVTNCTWGPTTDGPLSAYSPAGNGYGTSANLLPNSPQVYYATGYLANSGNSPTAVGGPVFNNKPTGRHLDGSNYCFADGHAKWLKPEVVSAGLAAGNPADAPTGDVSPYKAAGTKYSGGNIQGTFSPI